MLRRIRIPSVAIILFCAASLLLGAVSSAKAGEASPTIIALEVPNAKTAFVLTDESMLRTDDGGSTWHSLMLPLELGESLTDVLFRTSESGFAVATKNGRLSLLQTMNGGETWLRSVVSLTESDQSEAELSSATLSPDGRAIVLTLKRPSSSNFNYAATYRSDDDGLTWTFTGAEMSIKTDDDESRPSKAVRRSSLEVDESITKVVATDAKEWILTASGDCFGNKSNCVARNRVLVATASGTRDVTPPVIVAANDAAVRHAQLTNDGSVFALPPNGNTRISLHRGFDKCTAATITQMQTWWNSSPFYDTNIYMSGRNRGCTQAQLNANWVNSITAQGWGIIPTIVGYQSPCSVCTSCQKHSSDPATAEQQGRGEADIAIADAANLGLTTGTVLYYDMERYDDLSGTGACSTPTKAFLKGWTDRVKELGFISGVYGSPFNANGDWINMPAASQPDIVWLARWNNIMSVWGVAPLPDSYWTNHQRIHQWLGPRDENWGGVTFNIDNNISDAPVASAVIARNKRADFNGDGKTDLSVWRPDTGVWYVANSGSSTFSIQTFGLPTDIMTPGDYDGDGKTDFAVWRPTDGVWHILSRANYRSFSFGANGDIPVAADYDGDGRADPAVFRPSTGVWYVWNSFDSRGTSYSINQFGMTGDVPVTGDYDGDGKSDLAVFRPSTGVWYVLNSTGGFFAAQFGIATDVPAAADYDGDGKTDIAIFRDGVWYILQSRDGLAVVQFGSVGDVPAAGDYDGDGKYDPAVFRPSTGVWYVRQSSGGFLISQFGVNLDRPVPRAYTP